MSDHTNYDCGCSCPVECDEDDCACDDGDCERCHCVYNNCECAGGDEPDPEE